MFGKLDGTTLATARIESTPAELETPADKSVRSRMLRRMGPMLLLAELTLRSLINKMHIFYER
jgi:hypothetical protein